MKKIYLEVSITTLENDEVKTLAKSRFKCGSILIATLLLKKAQKYYERISSIS